jgi:predicted branched-subunit amino acid permease
MAVLMPGMIAWGLVAGVAMVTGGLSTWLATAMSLAVYSAGAQLGAIALMSDGVPPWIIVVSVFCVNLRFVIFSAALRPSMLPLPWGRRVLLGYLTADLAYVLFVQRYGHSAEPEPGQIPYLAGLCTTNWLGWQAATLIGIAFADSFPTHWQLGFAGVLALLGLGCTLLRDWASAVSASVAFVTALATRALPLRLNVVAAIAAAMTVGVACDRWAELRAEARP